MAESTVDVVTEAIVPALAALGLRLYDLEITGAGRGRVVRVLVDREGGVDLDAITRASEVVTPLLDAGHAAAALAGSFTLEVSSPGLERPLRSAEHFEGAVGEIVSVRSRDADGVAQRVRGTVTAAGDDAVELTLDDGQVVRIAYTAIVQARTVFEWGAPTPREHRTQGTHGNKGSTREVARR
jgi:ribosome maturation factor RimP